MRTGAALRRPPAVGRVLSVAIAAIVVVYLLALAINARDVLDSLYAHADAAAALVIAQLMPDAPSGREVVLGDYNWVEAIWLLRGTAWLPSHFAVWQVLPFAVWGATVALAAGAVRLVASRTAALLTAAVGICVGFGGREVFWTLNFHGLVTFHTALLAFWLAWLVARPQRAERRSALAVAALLGLVTAAGVQDQMLLAVGVLPLVVAGVVWWWWTRAARPLVLVGVVAVLALAGGALLHHVVTDAGIIRDERPFVFTPGGALLDHVGLLAGAIGELVAGKSLGNEVTLISVIALLGMLLAVAATTAVAWWGVRVVRGVAEAPRAAVPLRPADVLLAFWAAVILATAASWLFSGFVADVTDVRYLGTAWIGVGVGLGLLADRPGARVLAQAVVAGLCLVATIGVVHQIEPTRQSNFPMPRAAAAVRSFALANGARIGYAGNWDAFPLTWHNRFAVTLTPIQNCGDPSDGAINCPPPQHRISSWYHERPGDPRSFLVVDSSQPQNPSVDPRFGKALATTTYGPMTILVYDHDIARDVRPPGTRR